MHRSPFLVLQAVAISSGTLTMRPTRTVTVARRMILSRGDPTTFVTRPISAILLAIAVAVLIVVFLPSVKKKREEVFVEEA